MSVRALAVVFERSRATLASRLVMLALADYANDSGVCWPAQDRVAHKCMLSRVHVNRLIKQLVVDGELQVRKAQRGRKRLSIYRVSLPGLHEVVYDDLPFVLSAPFDDVTDCYIVASDGVTRGGSDDVTPHARGGEPSEEPSEDLAAATAVAVELKVKYDALWEAFIAAGVERPTTKAERGKLNSAVRELVEIDAEPDDIAKRTAVYMRNYPGVKFTARGLVGHWGESSPQRRTGPSLVKDCPDCIAAGSRSPMSLPAIQMKEHRYNAHGTGTVCVECGGVVMPDCRDSCPCGKLTNDLGMASDV